jgi:imidazolonepropionase-like amidohydrolase
MSYQRETASKIRRYSASFFILLIIALAASITAQKLKNNATEAQSYAFVNVSVVPMDKERIINEQTVIVRGEKIILIGPSPKTKVPSNAIQIDGSGKYLMPGLVDMHVHLRNYTDKDMSALLQLYVVNGVTTVLNLSGIPRHLELRDKVAKGELAGPTIYTSGPFISRTTGSSPSPEEVERAVIEQKQAGYDIIKIHGDFTRDAYHKLFEIARREGIRVIGHAPRNLGIDAMVEERQDAVAHAEEYIYDKNSNSRNVAEFESQIPSMARATAKVGTWLVPNLTAYKNIGLQVADLQAVLNRPEMKYMPPRTVEVWGEATNPYLRFRNNPIEKFWAQFRALQKLTKEFHVSGVRLLAGTDAMNPSVVPGFSLHDELRELVAAGLTAYEALKTATANPAEFLKSGKEFGTVAQGKRADLILLDRNPLDDVSFVSRRVGVMIKGQWLPQSELQKKLDVIASSNQRDK